MDAVFSNIILEFKKDLKDVRALATAKEELEKYFQSLYEENSNFYIFSKSSFKNAKNERIGIKPNYFEINRFESIDIDNKEDFLLAEAIYRQNIGL